MLTPVPDHIDPSGDQVEYMFKWFKDHCFTFWVTANDYGIKRITPEIERKDDNYHNLCLSARLSVIGQIQALQEALRNERNTNTTN